MIVLTILAIALSIGAIALCIRLCIRIDSVHVENMRNIVNYVGMLEQRIKILEEKVKKGENDG